ncbi:MAG: NAD(P)H-dependent oxidoreductase subunit E, partial [Gemmataceae bacterium]|nr:NAD(P)H-dependent oxidoreductase subunit E [Gemmataceae bacterium]
MLVKVLKELQGEKGWLSEDDLRAAARRADVPLYRVEEVASFFPHFRRTPPPAVLVQVCRDMSCHLAGSRKVMEECAKVPGATVEWVSCLGRCDRAPASVASVHGRFHDHLHLMKPPSEMRSIAEALVAGKKAVPNSDESHKDPSAGWMIDAYRRKPERRPFDAARALLEELGADDRSVPLPAGDTLSVRGRWLDWLGKANVLGMGGGGAPAARKWRDVAEQPGKPGKHVVANGDESEPGTFKDRELMLRCPELVVEGVILACLLTGASRGHVFIRHEYPEQAEAIGRAIDTAREAKVCGIPGLEVEVFVSPGGYICGEQSALLEAMEGRRAQPRDRPP